MSWLSQILESWINFPYFQEYLTSVVHPWWLLVLLILIYLPLVTLFFGFLALSFLLHIYKMLYYPQESDFSKFCEKPRKIVTQACDKLGKIWYGYEVIGMEHIPKGPGLIIYYHGVTTIDYALFVSKVYKETQRECFSVIHHFLYRRTGWKIFCDVIGLKDFTKAECVQLLKKGHFLGISPGGGREGNFSEDYSIVWGNRTGFAQVALEAKVPIIPMFTENISEVFRNFGRTRLTRWIYEKTRLFYLPMYGPFPVKLRTYIGEPIPYDPNITAAELAQKTKTAIENLRDKYQKRPGSILRALSQRFDKHYKAE